MGWILAGLFLLVALGNVTVALRWRLYGRSGTMFPLIGGLAGLGACFSLPFPSLHQYWWIPLLADLGTGYLTIATGLFMIRRILMRKRGADLG